MISTMKGTTSRLSSKLLLVVALLVQPAQAQKRDPHAVQPERPTVATHAGTVAPGWIELEEGAEWDKLADGTRLFVAPSNLKIGLASKAQLNLLVNVIKFTGRNASLGDLTIGVKYRLTEDHPWLGDFAILPAVKLPTASTTTGAGTGTTDVSLLFISSHQFGPVAMDLNAGQTRRSGDGSRAPVTAHIWTASFGFPISGRLGAVAEVFGYPRTSGPQGSDATAALLVGPTFTVREWLALDAGLITPLVGPYPHATYVGFVWNFGSLLPR
jgi:outer membrane putative beta-barrel porin/alpha-amylase